MGEERLSSDQVEEIRALLRDVLGPAGAGMVAVDIAIEERTGPRKKHER